MWYAAALLLAFGALYHLHRSVSHSGNHQIMLHVGVNAVLCYTVWYTLLWHSILVCKLYCKL